MSIHKDELITDPYRVWTSRDLGEILPISSTMHWVMLYAAVCSAPMGVLESS